MTSLDIVALAGAMEALPCAPSEEPVMEPVAAAAAGGGADAEVIVLSDDDEPKPKKQKPEPMLIYDVTPPWRQTSQATTAATATSTTPTTPMSSLYVMSLLDPGAKKAFIDLYPRHKEACVRTMNAWGKHDKWSSPAANNFVLAWTGQRLRCIHGE